MATVTQPSLFSWEIVDQSPEILRLQRVLDVLPDDELLDVLVAERAGRRNDYPILAVWNSLIAGIVFGHDSIASLIRELRRNAELRQICGFDPLGGDEVVPNAWQYSKFLKKLFDHAERIDAMFERLVERVRQLLPDFGAHLAIDGKALPAYGRKDADADWGVKTYRGVKDDGTPYKKVKRWFGYKLHLIVDADYELPVSYEVTQASEADINRMMPMIESLADKHPELYERAESLAADRGYDDGADKAALYDDHQITPVIDARDCHSSTPQGAMRPLDESTSDTIYIGPTGEVCCKVDPFAGKSSSRYAPMRFMGVEADRRCLKFRCPAAADGVECKNRDACRASYKVKHGAYGRVVRVPFDRDRRLFSPVYRHSRTFAEAYKRRAAVERVNSRVDRVYGFDRHYIRGIAKMRLRMGLSLMVMLATAVAWIEASQPEKARSLLAA